MNGVQNISEEDEADEMTVNGRKDSAIAEIQTSDHYLSLSPNSSLALLNDTAHSGIGNLLQIRVAMTKALPKIIYGTAWLVSYSVRH